MKRILCSILSVLLCFSFVGCGGKKELVVSDEYTQFEDTDKEYIITSVNKIIDYRDFITDKGYEGMSKKDISTNAVKFVVDIGVRDSKELDCLKTFLIINETSMLLSGMQSDVGDGYVDKLNEKFLNLSKLFEDSDYAYQLMKIDEGDYSKYIDSLN